MQAVQMELTNRCQLDCAECPRRLMSRPVGEMDLGLAQLIATDAVEFNRHVGFNLNGLGEPLLYKKLTDFLLFLKTIIHPSRRIDLFTNLAIPEKQVVHLFNVINSLGCNFLVATTRHMYDGRGAKEVPVSKFYDNNLRVVAQMTKNNPKIDLHSHMVLTKYHTQEDIDHFFAEFRKILPRDKVHVTKQLNPWFDLVAEMATGEGAEAGHTSRPAVAGRQICGYPFDTCHIGWDGEMIICCTDDVNQETTFGKVAAKGDLLRLWSSAKFQKIRHQFNNYFHDDINNAPPSCQKCHLLRWLQPKRLPLVG